MSQKSNRAERIARWIVELETPASAPDAAASLAGLIATDTTAVPGLTVALRDAHRSNRWALARALGLIGPGAAIAAPDLVACLAAAESELRQHAAHALAGVGARDSATLRSLEALLGDPDPIVGVTAAGALLRLGRDTPDAFTVLERARRDSRDVAVRDWAAHGLIGALEVMPAVLPRVIGLLAEEDGLDETAEDVGRALARLDREIVVPALRGLADAATPEVRRRVNIAFSMLEIPREGGSP